MAIFRKGVKIGGFDIRVGFPRDRSYDNIDKDPRLKQKANPDTTINRFRSMTQAAGGYARPTKYIIECTLPTALNLCFVSRVLFQKCRNRKCLHF